MIKSVMSTNLKHVEIIKFQARTMCDISLEGSLNNSVR